MRLPLLIESSAIESPVIRLFAGKWHIVASHEFENMTLLCNGQELHEVEIQAPCNIQIKRTSNIPLTVFAEKLS